MEQRRKEIFIEVLALDDGTGEQTFVDWSTGFTSLDEVMVALQAAVGAVMMERQKRIELNQRTGGIGRPDFVTPKKAGRN